MKQIIYHQQKTLRIAGTAEAPLLCAKDVCEMANISKYKDAIASLQDDEKVSVSVDTPSGRQEMIFVTEPGFYRIIFASRSPHAGAVKRWVFHQVLPQIRKTGYYRATGPNIPPALLALPPGRREQAIERLEICEEIRASRRVLECAKEISARHQGARGYSWRTLLTLYYRWMNADCDPMCLSAYHSLYKNTRDL
ncbi:MAG: hypothetical protein JO295_05835 [Verrucomicrobia bacterium]|nr:hypothetical protein [Verrucomicrobiota bacterium]